MNHGRRPRAAHRFFSPPEFREVSVIDYPAEFVKDVPTSGPVKGDEVDTWYHHHHNSPQFDKLRGRVEEAKQKHSVGGGGSGLPGQRQGILNSKPGNNRSVVHVLNQELRLQTRRRETTICSRSCSRYSSTKAARTPKDCTMPSARPSKEPRMARTWISPIWSTNSAR